MKIFHTLSFHSRINSCMCVLSKKPQSFIFCRTCFQIFCGAFCVNPKHHLNVMTTKLYTIDISEACFYVSKSDYCWALTKTLTDTRSNLLTLNANMKLRRRRRIQQHTTHKVHEVLPTVIIEFFLNRNQPPEPSRKCVRDYLWCSS